MGEVVHQLHHRMKLFVYVLDIYKNHENKYEHVMNNILTFIKIIIDVELLLFSLNNCIP